MTQERSDTDAVDPAGAGTTVPGAGASASRQRRALVLLGLGVTLALVVVALRTLDLAEVWEAIRASEARWIVPSVALLGVGVFLRAVRWQALFVAESRPALRPVTSSILVGYLFNTILPLRAGEAARLVALHARTRVSRMQIAATVGLERLYDLVGLLLVFALSLPFLPEVTWLRTAAWLGGALLAVLVVAVLVVARYEERGLRILLWPLRLLPFVTQEQWEYAPRHALRGLRGLTDPWMAAVALGWTVLSWLVLSLSAWVLMLGFDLGLDPAAGVLVTVAIGLGMTIPAGPAALGVFEAAVVVALAAYGVRPEQALSYALVLHAVNAVPYLVAGLAVILAPARGRAPRA